MGRQIERDLRPTLPSRPGARDWYPHAMRTTIDKAGRLVIPKPLRDRLGLRPGEVEVTADGTALRVEAVTADVVEEVRGRLVIPSAGAAITSDEVRTLRDADQR